MQKLKNIVLGFCSRNWIGMNFTADFVEILSQLHVSSILVRLSQEHQACLPLASLRIPFPVNQMIKVSFKVHTALVICSPTNV